jgi:putative ABC transport system permease protein
MMTALRAGNRAMYWRIVRRLLGANRGRLFVILLALGAGAAVTAALLNLQVDAKQRIAWELSIFGPNYVVVPRDMSEDTVASRSLDQSIVTVIKSKPYESNFYGIPFLYLLANVSSEGSPGAKQAVVAGTNLGYPGFGGPGWKVVSKSLPITSETDCIAGINLAAAIHLQAGSIAHLQNGNHAEQCTVAVVLSTGGSEDNQILVSLRISQRLAGLPGRLSLVKLVIFGTPNDISNRVSVLRQQLPQADIRPIRQFAEGETKIYNRISGLLTATIVIVLLLTGLCVMAAMTNVAMERRNDVGLMKAIGGATRRVLRLFMMEAALLGLAGGVIGAAVGIFLSIWLGKQVFGVAAQPRLIVYPVSVALTTIVAVLSAYPLRRLASVRPASVFRGEA